MPSIAEIARYADVSRCTASQILNKSTGHKRFSQAVQQRVQSVAAQLGWARDSRGLALQQGKTGVLALAIKRNGNANGLQRALISAVEEAARKRDQHLQIIGGDISEAVQAVHCNRCDGVLAIGWDLSSEDCIQLRACNHAILCKVPEGMHGVDIDISNGIIRAVAHLHSLGHRSILWLHTDRNIDHDIRWQICRSAAKKFSMKTQRLAIPINDCVADEAGELAAIQKGLQQILPRIAPHTAVLCYNELVAIGLYAAVAGSRHIPNDLSIIGVDNIYAHICIPPMTSISFELDAMADQAVAILLHPKGKNKVQQVAASLVIRESTTTHLK